LHGCVFGLDDAVAVAVAVPFPVDVPPPVRTINEFVVPVAVPLERLMEGNVMVLVGTVLVVDMEVYVRPEGSTPSPDNVPVTAVPLITVTDWANTTVDANIGSQTWRGSILGVRMLCGGKGFGEDKMLMSMKGRRD
jgi:hypothetical protein